MLRNFHPAGRNVSVNKHSESIAIAIQVPYCPNNFSRGLTSEQTDERGLKVELDLHYVESISYQKQIKVIRWAKD